MLVEQRRRYSMLHNNMNKLTFPDDDTNETIFPVRPTQTDARITSIASQSLAYHFSGMFERPHISHTSCSKPISSSRRHEGKKKEDIEYVFHQKEGTVTPVLSRTPGVSLSMNVYHDKKNRPVEVRDAAYAEHWNT